MALFEPVFEALNAASVRYVVVGGYAVLLHGHARLTADIDLVVDLSPEEAKRAIAVLVGLGLRPRPPVPAEGFADPAMRARWVSEKGMTVFTMHSAADPLLVVDLFVQEPIPFPELWEQAREVDLGAVRVRIASIDHLILMKRNAGRPHDAQDIHALEALRRPPGGRVEERLDWEGARAAQRALSASATIGQRLAWLEEALQLARKSGALPRR